MLLRFDFVRRTRKLSVFVGKVDKEEAEIAIIQTYLPAPATDDEIREAVAAAIRETEATSLRDMG